MAHSEKRTNEVEHWSDALLTPGVIDLEERDLDDRVGAVKEEALHLNDRVERRSGSSEASRWGTITARVEDDEGSLWIVVDNVGVTHRDSAADLLLAVRGRGRNLFPGES